MEANIEYRHLFLEGDSESGKSSALREMLNPVADKLGGFFCQRLLDSSGNKVAYRIVRAGRGDIELTVPYSRELTGIFLDFSSKRVTKNPAIFEDTACRYMSEEGKKIILIDEVGGFELLSPYFYETVREVISGRTPCIGVLKSEKNLRNMIDGGAVPPECMDLNRALRSHIKNSQGAVIRFERQRSAEIKQQLRQFIHYTVLQDMEEVL